MSCRRGGETVPFVAVHQYARPGLLLSRGTVYAGFGSVAALEGDPRYVYNGWVMGSDAQTLETKGVFCVSPHAPERGGALVGTKSGGGIWQSGGGLVGDADGNVYFETGNGFYSQAVDGPPTSRPDGSFEDSFVKLRPLPASGTEWQTSDVLGVFTPGNGAAEYRGSYQELERADLDLGSGGPSLLPGGTLVGGGKYGKYHHLRQSDLSPIQEFQAFTNSWNPGWEEQTLACSLVDACEVGKGDFAPNLHGGPVVWTTDDGRTFVYSWAEKDYLKAYAFDPRSSTFAPGGGVPRRSPLRAAEHSMPGGALSISASGGSGGVLWATVQEPFGQCDAHGDLWRPGGPGAPVNCDALELQVPGRFYAFDATTLELLFEDRVTKFQKFSSPIVARDRVFVPEMADAQATPSGHNRVRIYGLLAAPPPSGPRVPDYRPVDVDGDGKQDLVARDAFGFFSIWRADASGLAYADGFYGQTPACPSPHCPADVTATMTGNATGQPIPYGDAGWNARNRFTWLDLDGDGDSDLVARQADGRVDVWLSNGRTLDYRTTSPGADSDAAGFGAQQRLLAGRFDGATAREQWLVRHPDGSWAVWQWDGAALAPIATVAAGHDDAAWGEGERFVVVDLDGDGRDELLARAPGGGLEVWSASGSGAALTLTRTHTATAPFGGEPAALAAVRVSGRGGLLVRAADGSASVYLAAQLEPGRWGLSVSAFGVEGGLGADLFPADLDGDRTSELLVRGADGTLAILAWDGAGYRRARAVATRFTDASGWRTGARFF